MRDFQPINMYEMSMILTDGGGGRRRKGVWRSDDITDLLKCSVFIERNLIVSVLIKNLPAFVDSNCLLMQPTILMLLNPLCLILPYSGDLLHCYCTICKCIFDFRQRNLAITF
jgi:hypothetical protein